MPKLPDFKSKPIKGYSEENWKNFTVQRIVGEDKANFSREFITQEHRSQQAESLTQWHATSIEHKEMLRKNFLGDNNPSKRPEVVAKRNKTFRTSGKQYIELTTNTIGYVTDLSEKFNLPKPFIIGLAKKGILKQEGKGQGLHFQIYQP